MIYADHNATTPLSIAARTAIGDALETWGNPSSTHQQGRRALELLNKSRESVAIYLGRSPHDIVFTSGGSEANTSVLLGGALNNPSAYHLITTAIEHSSVRDGARFLETLGSRVDYIRTLPSGLIDLEHLALLLRQRRPNLVSVMTANNETGAVQPLADVLRLCEAAGVALHTDAVQALGKISPEVFSPAAFVSISAHKIHGPKGVGALCLREGHPLLTTHFGGSQEIKRRGGTENVPGIAGFGAAIGELGDIQRWDYLQQWRNRMEDKLLTHIEGCSIQAHSVNRLPNTTNFRIAGIPSEVLLSALDLDAVCVSAGSACSSGSVSPSHVLLAMGLTREEARECVRVSWDLNSTVQEIDTVTELVIDHAERIRSRRKGRTAKSAGTILPEMKPRI